MDIHNRIARLQQKRLSKFLCSAHTLVCDDVTIALRFISRSNPRVEYPNTIVTYHYSTSVHNYGQWGLLKSSYSVMNIHCILFTLYYSCFLFKNNLYNS